MKKRFFVFYMFWASFIPVLSQELPLTFALDLKEEPNTHDSFIPFYEIKRPKLALVLSGGGARGLAQIGVIKALEENHIPIDLIVGVSMGSIIGGLYASGYSADEIAVLASGINWMDVFDDSPPRSTLFLGQKQAHRGHLLQVRFDGLKPIIPSSLSAGQKLTNLITDLTKRANFPVTSDFNHLKIPFRAVATDLISGRKVVLREGDLGEAMRASMAVPLLFTPVEKDGMLLVDGGLVDNIPIDVARDWGADVVITADVTSRLRSPDQLKAAWEIADQVTTIMQEPANRRQLAAADLVITFGLEGYLNTDFGASQELLKEGYRATVEKIPTIRELIEGYRKPPRDQSFFVDYVKISGNHQVRDSFILPLINLRNHSTITSTEIRGALERVHNTGYFARVEAILEEQSFGRVLTFHLRENPALRSIEIIGNTVIPDGEILGVISSPLDSVINIPRGRGDIAAVHELYRQGGYSLAHLERRYFDPQGKLSLIINEGLIDLVLLEGNEVTKPGIVLREFPLKPEQVFNINRADRGVANVYGTGLFDQVYLTVTPSGRKAVIGLKLKEKKYHLLRLGARYCSERRGKGSLEYLNDNLWGYGGKLSFRLYFGEQERAYRASLRADRIFRTYFTYNLIYHLIQDKFYHYTNQHHRERVYWIDRQGILLLLGQQLKRLGTVSAQIKLERVSDNRPGEEEEFDLRNVLFSSVIDNLDRYPFPRWGNSYQLTYEFASKALDSEASYFKLHTHLETYLSPHRLHTFRLVFFGGISDLTTPFSEKFRLGGQDSFYGLNFGELWGRQVFGGSIEYRQEFLSKLFTEAYFSLRYDVGGIWDQADIQISTQDFRHGLGTRLSLGSPLGPIHVSYGRLFGGKSWEENDIVYFSAGYKF